MVIQLQFQIRGDNNTKFFNNDGYSFYDPNSGVTRNNQRWDVFKNNQNDPTLNTLTKDKNGKYPGLSILFNCQIR